MNQYQSRIRLTGMNHKDCVNRPFGLLTSTIRTAKLLTDRKIANAKRRKRKSDIISRVSCQYSRHVGLVIWVSAYSLLEIETQMQAPSLSHSLPRHNRLFSSILPKAQRLCSHRSRLIYSREPKINSQFSTS